MNREFKVEEIMLDGVSGCVRGTVEIVADQIESVACVSFRFRDDRRDCPATLSEAQRTQATEIVERTLSSVELAASASPILVSADRFSPAASESRRVLAEFLSAPRDVASEAKDRIRRAQ